MSDTPTEPAEPAAAPAPRSTTEVSLIGPEFMPVYANFVREPSPLPPAPPGGNWTLGPP